jgi:hypothetical protein
MVATFILWWFPCLHYFHGNEILLLSGIYLTGHSWLDIATLYEDGYIFMFTTSLGYGYIFSLNVNYESEWVGLRMMVTLPIILYLSW